MQQNQVTNIQSKQRTPRSTLLKGAYGYHHGVLDFDGKSVVKDLTYVSFRVCGKGEGRDQRMLCLA